MRQTGVPGFCAETRASLVFVRRHASLVFVLASLFVMDQLLVPMHAGHADQPGVRAKVCWPTWCSCQDMLASPVFVPRVAGQPGVRGKTWAAWSRHTCWPAWSSWASLVFVPRHAGQPGVRAWPAWCLCQDMLASLVFVPCCSCQDMLASLVFVGACCSCQGHGPAWCS